MRKSFGRNMEKRVWISWERHRRNQTTSSAVGAELFVVDHGHKARSVLRYLLATISTLRILIKERPKLVFVQNPSMVLTLLALQYGRLFRTPVIVDAHNAGVRPFDGRSRWANKLAGYAMRTADLTIVTNRALAEHVDRHGGRSAILPDPLPDISCTQRTAPLQGKVNVLFICTWASDEPYIEVIRAAGFLDSSICIYITGNSKGRENAFGEPLPGNIVLTGYVSDEDYVRLMCSVDIIVDLTTRDDCLVCGAYEAISIEKPLILSDTVAIREYFSEGVLYTDNTAEDIARQIRACIERQAVFEGEVKKFKKDLALRWQEIKCRLDDKIASCE